MAALKWQAFRLNTGQHATDNIDFRGDRAHLLTGEEGDHHRTSKIPPELDPCPDGVLAVMLQHGPAINKGFEAVALAEPEAFGELATVLGLEGTGPVGFRAVVMDS